jgi:hypothetical protein
MVFLAAPRRPVLPCYVSYGQESTAGAFIEQLRGAGTDVTTVGVRSDRSFPPMMISTIRVGAYRPSDVAV